MINIFNVVLNTHNQIHTGLTDKIKTMTRPRHYRLSDCPVPVKTNVGQVDLVLRLSDGTSEKNRFPNVPVRRTNHLVFHISFNQNKLWTNWRSNITLIQQTQYFIPVQTDLSVVSARLGICFFHLSRRTTVIQWLKLKWNTRSKLFYWYHLSCFDEVQGHWQT
jgi:hypothetical protein